MRKVLAALAVLALAAAFQPSHAAGIQPARIEGPITPGDCSTLFNVSGIIHDSGAPCGGSGAPGGSSYSLQFNNAGTFGGLLPGETGLHMPSWSSLSAAPTIVQFNAALVVAQFTGCTGSLLLGADGACHAGGASSFDQIGSGTNTNTLTMGTGGVITYANTGIVNANELLGFNFPTPISGDYLTYNGTAFLWSTPPGGGNISSSGTPAAGQAAEFTDSTHIQGVAVTGSGSYMKATAPTFTLPNYTTAGEPACAAGNKAQQIFLTDGSGAEAICNGTAWITSGGTQFTYMATGCTPSAASGSAAAGSITLAAGPCTSIVITPNGATGLTATNGWICTVGDRTTQAAGTWIPKWGETTSTATTVTIPIPGAAGATDVINFSCVPY